jgi:hypothetical protein
MGCYQGAQRQRLAWSSGAGVAVDRIMGSAGETESALSTCLLLHLLEEGPGAIDSWFSVWMSCNDSFRPHFDTIRSTYARMNADPLAALLRLRAEGQLSALFRDYEEFLSVIPRQPGYLTDLM